MPIWEVICSQLPGVFSFTNRSLTPVLISVILPDIAINSPCHSSNRLESLKTIDTILAPNAGLLEFIVLIILLNWDVTLFAVSSSLQAAIKHPILSEYNPKFLLNEDAIKHSSFSSFAKNLIAQASLFRSPDANP
eukprot:NODE_45_length_27728_cov_0.328387.p20 type:complete len:135 gc:universal NODE_45_length_27728_cov_0.328387:3392-3796(+)